VVSDDDSEVSTTSTATFTATAGATYRFAVDGYGGITGAIVLRIFPAAPSELIYSTDFEWPWFFGFPVAGYGGWVDYGSGGDMVVYENLYGYAQSASIGLFPAPNPGDWLYLYPPLGYTPKVSTLPVVRFSVVMNIFDSMNYEYDDFMWEVYNMAGNRLFTLDFGNLDLHIYHRLSGTSSPWVDSGFSFENGVTYRLNIMMELGANGINPIPGWTRCALNTSARTRSVVQWRIRSSNLQPDHSCFFCSLLRLLQVRPLPRRSDSHKPTPATPAAAAPSQPRCWETQTSGLEARERASKEPCAP
jgi:hypothetical protein